MKLILGNITDCLSENGSDCSRVKLSVTRNGEGLFDPFRCYAAQLYVRTALGMDQKTEPRKNSSNLVT